MRIGRSALLSASVLLIVVVLLMPAATQAQTTGEITGQVFDNSKASIAGATVSAKNVGTGEIRSVQTDSQGHYKITELRIGTYDVSAEHQGFRREIKTGALLTVTATIEMNFTLQVGVVNEEVVVTSDAPVSMNIKATRRLEPRWVRSNSASCPSTAATMHALRC